MGSHGQPLRPDDLFGVQASSAEMPPPAISGWAFAQRTSFVAGKVDSGEWREGRLNARDAGLSRDPRIFLASRKTNPIVRNSQPSGSTYCPPLYWDLAIGSGPCGLGCRGCYLLGTFRDRRDPYQPLLYDNYAFFWEAVRKWLLLPERKPIHSLGLGTDRSDSLLFEHVTGHARRLIPMFADRGRNPTGCKLLLLTKSKNVHHLAGLPTTNIIVSFSLNPQSIADLWEGRWPDSLERITPPIEERLEASMKAQRMGFEVRWRIDPILTPDGWEKHYDHFLKRARAQNHQPTRITLGTFRETTPQLDYWRRRWGLPEMGWRPETLQRDGTHWHCAEETRVNTYRAVEALCRRYMPSATMSLCKETRSVRTRTGLTCPACNCLALLPGRRTPPTPHR